MGRAPWGPVGQRPGLSREQSLFLRDRRVLSAAAWGQAWEHRAHAPSGLLSPPSGLRLLPSTCPSRAQKLQPLGMPQLSSLHLLFIFQLTCAVLCPVCTHSPVLHVCACVNPVCAHTCFLRVCVCVARACMCLHLPGACTCVPGACTYVYQHVPITGEPRAISASPEEAHSLISQWPLIPGLGSLCPSA